MEYLFSYGTLKNPEVQVELFGRELRSFKDVLTGYRVQEIEIRDEDFLSTGSQSLQKIAIPSVEEDTIEGLVLEMSRDELLKADAYEPDDYHRVKVNLASGKQAWLYAAK